jgi:hypothetical protein
MAVTGTLVSVVAIIVAGLGLQTPSETASAPSELTRAHASSQQSVPQVGEVRNDVDLRAVYDSVKTKLPPHTAACFPAKKVNCEEGKCQESLLGVFILLGGNKFSQLSRCDRTGCETHDALAQESGEFINIQAVQPRGVLLKVSLKTNDFVEIATIGMTSYLSSGKCISNVH